MKELLNIEHSVRNILTLHPYTRNSDDALYLEICLQANAIACNMSFKDVMAHRKDFGLPKFESVRRARQKMQSQYEELRAVTEVENGRMEEYEVYKEYAKQV